MSNFTSVTTFIISYKVYFNLDGLRNIEYLFSFKIHSFLT